MSWFSDKLKEATAQINPFDHGQTAQTVRQARKAPPPAVTQKIQTAKYGVLANNPNKQNELLRSIKPKSYSTIRNAGGALMDTNKAIVKPFWETGDTVKAAIKGDSKNFTESLDQSVVGGVGRFGQKVATAALTPVTMQVANREAERRRKLLTPTYGANNADIEANNAKMGIMENSLNRAGSSIYDTKADNFRKTAAAATEAGLDIATVGVGGATAKQAAKGTLKSVAPQMLKNAPIGAAGNVAYGLQQNEVTPIELVKQAATGAAIGMAIPAAGAVAGKGIGKATRGVKKAMSGNSDLAIEIGILRDMSAAEQRATGPAKAQLKQQVFDQQRKIQEMKASGKKYIKPLNQGGYVKNPMGKEPTGADLEIAAREAYVAKKNPQVEEPQPRQRSLEESTAPYSNEQTALVKQYSKMLSSVDESAKGGITVPDGEGGYKRVTEHSKFYQDFYAANGRKPSAADWEKEAARQLSSGTADGYAQKMYNDLQDPEFQSLANQVDAGAMGPTSIGDILAQDPIKAFRIKVKNADREKQVPVMLQQKAGGDTVVATNMNPDIKKGEKRYSVDDNGELIPDDNGAYHLFTDEDGKVKGFRVGKEFFSTKDLGELSNVNGYGSTFATMRRNIEKAFDKETGAKVNRFLVDYQQDQATKMIERHLALKEGMKTIADDLGIDFATKTKKAKKISAAIQNLGEDQVGINQITEEFGPEMASKISKADQWFRKQYDLLLAEMNRTLEDHGYEPVPKRKDYYTHFQEPGLWENFGLKMNEIKSLASPTLQDASPDMVRGKISNSLAGNSENLTPNKRFNPFAQRRLGETHTADAFQSFERYLAPTLNNIYMTPAISRARVLAKAVTQEADVANKDANKTLIQLKEWANNLAGKSSRLGDRQLADTMNGGRYLAMSQWLQKKVGQNTIVGNLATAAMQPVVSTQAIGQFGSKNMLLAAIQEASSAHGADAAIRQSKFLKRRYSDVTPVTAGKAERAGNIANTPLKVIEETTTRIIWNAAHNQALEKNLKGAEAIRYADAETEKTVAGRSIGEKPEIYRTKTLGPVTMYQLEVNNFWQQMKGMDKKQAARTFTAMYAFNLLLQQTTGRQVGFNPIDAAIDSYQETQKDEKSAKDKAVAIGQRWAGEVVDNTPIVAPIANATIGDKSIRKLLGPESNTGKFGVSSPIAAVVSNPEMLVSPFGSSQAKKTYKGAMAIKNEGIVNKDGEKVVDIPRTPGNVAKNLLFGPASTQEGSQYYANLGLKKEDQKPVANQAGSIAGTQSLKGLTKDQQEMLRDTPVERRAEFVKTFLEKNQMKREKDAGKTTAPSGSTTSKLATIKSESDQRNLELRKTMSPDDYEISTMSKAERKKLVESGIKTQAELDGLDQYVKDQKKKLGFDVKDATTPKTRYENALKTYNEEKSTYTAVENAKKAKSLKSLKVAADYDEDTIGLHGMSKQDVWDLLSTDKNGKAMADKLLAYDKALTAAGVQSANKFTDKYGNIAIKPKEKGTSGSKGSRKGKYDYKLFGFKPTQKAKSLRQLVEEASKKSTKKA